MMNIETKGPTLTPRPALLMRPAPADGLQPVKRREGKEADKMTPFLKFLVDAETNLFAHPDILRQAQAEHNRLANQLRGHTPHDKIAAAYNAAERLAGLTPTKWVSKFELKYGPEAVASIGPK